MVEALRFPGIEDVIDKIAECELDYRESLTVAMQGGNLRKKEQALLDKLDDEYLPALVYEFDTEVPPPRERGGRLALESAYYEWNRTSGDPEARLWALIRSFLAAETERQGMFRLSRAQNSRIAEHYVAMGREFTTVGLFAHAAAAYQGAAEVYLQLRENTNRDLALLNMRRALHRTRNRGLAWAQEVFFGASCGYGYRPQFLLGWMVVLLGSFSGAVWGFSSVAFDRCLRGSLVNFLNPLGLGDVDQGFGGIAQWLFVTESYVGYVTLTVFFALLLRRWFQV